MPAIDKAVASYKLDAYYQQALNLIVSGRAREAFALDQKRAKIRDRYGRNTFGQSCLLARRLVEAGTRVVEIIWPKFANSDNHSWDHHVDLTKRMKMQSGPMFDTGLSALVADLDQRGLLDCSEAPFDDRLKQVPRAIAGSFMVHALANPSGTPRSPSLLLTFAAFLISSLNGRRRHSISGNRIPFASQPTVAPRTPLAASVPDPDQRPTPSTEAARREAREPGGVPGP